MPQGAALGNGTLRAPATQNNKTINRSRVSPNTLARKPLPPPPSQTGFDIPAYAGPQRDYVPRPDTQLHRTQHAHAPPARPAPAAAAASKPAEKPFALPSPEIPAHFPQFRYDNDPGKPPGSSDSNDSTESGNQPPPSDPIYAVPHHIDHVRDGPVRRADCKPQVVEASKNRGSRDSVAPMLGFVQPPVQPNVPSRKPVATHRPTRHEHQRKRSLTPPFVAGRHAFGADQGFRSARDQKPLYERPATPPQAEQRNRQYASEEPRRGRPQQRQDVRRPFVHEGPGLVDRWTGNNFVDAAEYDGTAAMKEKYERYTKARAAVRAKEQQQHQSAGETTDSESENRSSSRDSTRSKGSSWSRGLSPIVGAIKRFGRSMSRERKPTIERVDAEYEKNAFLANNVPATPRDEEHQGEFRKQAEAGRRPGQKVGHKDFAAAKKGDTHTQTAVGFEYERAKKSQPSPWERPGARRDTTATTFDWMVDAAEGRIPPKHSEPAPPVPSLPPPSAARPIPIKSRPGQKEPCEPHQSADSHHSAASKSSSAATKGSHGGSSIFSKIMHKSSKSTDDTESILSFHCIGDEFGESKLLTPTTAKTPTAPREENSFEQYEKQKAERRRKEREAAELRNRERAQAQPTKQTTTHVHRKLVIKDDALPAELHHLAFPGEPRVSKNSRCRNCNRLLESGAEACTDCKFPTPFNRAHTPAGFI